ncbi:hypothetical protein DP114_15165 [Brasilonema sennae CENA114]|uniref:PEP-CTERM sorting domain-containing protein n=1 Tax=Brasilonema sennae CENA114 TaxID=415709 RepID=A0A856MFN8_9CYAN|nr:hypothetical protein [Brasilonema sennae]QDL09060.1 hypothetical protein DP114_15165 [Brasilonema sennae CENA114]
MIKKLAKIISAAALLTTVFSLVPQSALAQKFSGATNNSVARFSFDLNTSAPYTGGVFSGAIQNAIYDINGGTGTSSSPQDRRVFFQPGDLAISLETLSESELKNTSGTGLNDRTSSFQGKFGTTVVKYQATVEATLENDPQLSSGRRFLSFEFYAPYVEPFTNLTSLSVFNASNLTPFLNPQGQVEFPENIDYGNNPLDLSPRPTFRGFIFTPGSDDVTKVPEPAITASLLGFGIVSTALLHKRNKRLKASLSNGKRR